MALAILKPGELSDQGWRFAVDIGKNRYYRYIIGKTEARHSSGIRVIGEKSYISPLTGPLEVTRFGRDTFIVPSDQFTKDTACIQIYSYRTPDMKGVAVSDIQRVRFQLKPDDLQLPDISFSTSLQYAMGNTNTAFAYAENVAFAYRERKMSQAMFLENIMRVVGTVLPSLTRALPQLGSLLPALNGTPTGGGTATATAPGIPPALTALLNSPEVSRLLQDLLTRTLQGSGTAPAAVEARAAQQSLSAGFERYSEAKIAPALLAALPALMPLLQQVLSPETIGRVLDQPQRMIGAVTDGLVNLGRVGIESHEQDLRHLRELHAVNGPPVDALLAAMSLSLTDLSEAPRFRRLPGVKLTFSDVVPLAVEGKQRVVYAFHQPLSFPLNFESPGAVSQARLHLSIRHPKDARTLVSKQQVLNRVDSGPLPVVPRIALEEVQDKLKPQEDYLVTARLTWTNKRGETVGTVMSQVIYLIDHYIYGGVDGAGEAIPLQDVDKYRAFWHKVWATSFRAERRRYKIDCKYYYVLEKDRPSIGRMETLSQEGDEEGVVAMRMKSGTRIPVQALNQLLPQVSPHPALTEAELGALMSDDFVERFHTVARMGLEFRGRADENAVLWVYPEVKLQRFILKAPTSINAHGAVSGLTDHIIHFPIPAAIHFVGAKSGI